MAFLGAFIIANILMMVVLERKREIGILMSMGMERPRILWLFLVEGVLLGAMGSGAGVIVGTVAERMAVGQGHGLDKDHLGSRASPWTTSSTPRSIPLNVAWLFLVGILVAVIVSFLPSRMRGADGSHRGNPFGMRGGSEMRRTTSAVGAVVLGGCALA